MTAPSRAKAHAPLSDRSHAVPLGRTGKAFGFWFPTTIGEASNTCGPGTGSGIAPRATSRTTVTLDSGRYTLVCNLPGHYSVGMDIQLTVQ